MIVRLRVGGITLAVHSRRLFPAVRLPKALLPFRPSRCADIWIDLVEDAAPRPMDSDLLFDSGSLWKIYRCGKDLLYAFRSPDGGVEFCRALAIDLDRQRGTLFLPPSPWSNKQGFALSYPLDELLFQHYAARAGWAFVHACGVATGRIALLFCGKSGAGKTTMARLWRSHRQAASILSDDRILIRNKRGMAWAFGTPWHGSGKFASPAGRQLTAIFFLGHSQRTRIEPLRQPTAAAELFARSFSPPWESETIGRVLEQCERIVSSVPCYKLAFHPDRFVIDAIEDCCKDIE
jgi:hypothetical protein